MSRAEFDLNAAHEHFSAQCFNDAWELLDKPDRSAEEDEQMIRLALASHWHWTQREDCTATNISVAYWQTSRVYAAQGQADNARHYARRCLAASDGDDVPAFYLGYAYEALARAEHIAGDHQAMDQYLSIARQMAETIADKESRQWLLDDLETIE
mgnify:CR=1 FL=1